MAVGMGCVVWGRVHRHSQFDLNSNWDYYFPWIFTNKMRRIQPYNTTLELVVGGISPVTLYNQKALRLSWTTYSGRDSDARPEFEPHCRTCQRYSPDTPE